MSSQQREKEERMKRKKLAANLWLFSKLIRS
jgi:hypothetical protein